MNEKQAPERWQLPTDAVRRDVRELIANARHAAIATLAPDTGAPQCTRVGLATLPDGTPLIFCSALAAHTPALLADPRLQDPHPQSPGARAAADSEHRGDPALDTVDWDGPGNLRVDYVLPAAGLEVQAAGVLWPQTGRSDRGIDAETVARASRHRLVWVDLGR